MAPGGPVEEDIMQNPFLRVLRANFEGLCKQVAERGESTVILVPCAECVDGDSFSQVFVETHILQATPIPGLYMNLVGQGIEIKDSSLSSQLGFSEPRSCEVMQSESMYDFNNHFQVLVIDKPLIGRYRARGGAADRSAAKAGPGGMNAGAQLGGAGSVNVSGPDVATDWLNLAPAIQDSFFDQIHHFRKTFVQVPGCEQSTAERIREIVGEATRRLIRHHNLVQPSQHRQLDYQVGRNAYAALHSFVFPHLQRILAEPEKRLEKAIRSSGTVEELVETIPGAQGRSLGLVDVRASSEQLDLMDHKITPHEKIACIDEAHSLLQRCVAEGVRGGQRAREGAIEITGDDVISLFILAVHGSSVQHRLAHVAHVEMYLQGAAGRSGSSEAARFEEAGYAVSALQAAFQFFLEERRPTASGTGRGAVRSTTNIFSSYLQPGGVGADAEGLVRQARAQGPGPQQW